MSVIALDGVTKRYTTRAGQVNALNDISLEIPSGQFVALRGPSGSGKTTLLMVMAGMLRPSAGTVAVAQQDVYALGQQARARFRGRHVGFVFQMFHLVPYLRRTSRWPRAFPAAQIAAAMSLNCSSNSAWPAARRTSPAS